MDSSWRKDKEHCRAFNDKLGLTFLGIREGGVFL